MAHHHSLRPTARAGPFLHAACWMALPLVCRAALVPFDPTDTAGVPKLLSQTGIYADIASKTPDTALRYFDINAPLWSDGAAKQRWIALPPGRQLAYNDTTDLFDYPDSTVFVKNFLLERVEGDTASRVYWETRLLVNRRDPQGANVWHGFSYRWNAAASEAHLVSLENGFDTIFPYYPNGLAQPQSYKKWRFPTQQNCNLCHVRSSLEPGVPAGRGVLGFFPAQLKRPAPSNPAANQIAALFARGIFSGAQPGSQALAKRWKSIHEPIPAGIAEGERFRILDTMARSYIAGNCSGCHGSRGILNSPSVPADMNFDFHTLYPRREFGLLPVADTKNLENPEEGSANYGRPYFIESVFRSGLDTAAGAIWDMRLPNPSAPPPAFVYPGFPAVSLMLYRQLVRKAPWRDSAQVRTQLTSGGDPDGWLNWIFSAPWGSETWRSQLAQHNVGINDVVAYARDGGSSGGQMPPVAASFLPDTKALRILAEWIKGYRTLYVVDSARIITGTRNAAQRPNLTPTLRGRVLVLPQGSTGPVLLMDMQGRGTVLQHKGNGRYAVPGALTRGMYALRIGSRSYRVILSD